MPMPAPLPDPLSTETLAQLVRRSNVSFAEQGWVALEVGHTFSGDPVADARKAMREVGQPEVTIASQRAVSSPALLMERWPALAEWMQAVLQPLIVHETGDARYGAKGHIVAYQIELRQYEQGSVDPITLVWGAHIASLAAVLALDVTSVHLHVAAQSARSNAKAKDVTLQLEAGTLLMLDPRKVSIELDTATQPLVVLLDCLLLAESEPEPAPAPAPAPVEPTPTPTPTPTPSADA